MDKEITEILHQLIRHEIMVDVAKERILRLLNVSGSLPTNEEIEDKAKEYEKEASCDQATAFYVNEDFIEGAKWMRSLISGNDR